MRSFKNQWAKLSILKEVRDDQCSGYKLCRQIQNQEDLCIVERKLSSGWKLSSGYYRCSPSAVNYPDMHSQNSQCCSRNKQMVEIQVRDSHVASETKTSGSLLSRHRPRFRESEMTSWDRRIYYQQKDSGSDLDSVFQSDIEPKSTIGILICKRFLFTELLRLGLGWGKQGTCFGGKKLRGCLNTK